jgi:hypothetical protein
LASQHIQQQALNSPRKKNEKYTSVPSFEQLSRKEVGVYAELKEAKKHCEQTQQAPQRLLIVLQGVSKKNPYQIPPHWMPLWDPVDIHCC